MLMWLGYPFALAADAIDHASHDCTWPDGRCKCPAPEGEELERILNLGKQCGINGCTKPEGHAMGLVSGYHNEGAT
jgi:hypothetical protein